MRSIVLAAFATLISFNLCGAQTEQLSPDVYRKLTCLQILKEGHAVSKRGFALTGLPAGDGGTEGSSTAPATIAVWSAPPSHLSGEKLAELSNATRQIDALEMASISSQCSIRFERPIKR